MSNKFLLVLFCFCTFSEIRESDSAKILYISFLSSKSHEIVYRPLLQKLIEKGHTLTIVNPINLDLHNSYGNRTEFIQTLPLEEWQKGKDFPNLFEMRESSLFKYASVFLNHFLFFGNVMDDICRTSYQLPKVKQLLSEEYSLILFSSIFNECLFGLVYQLNAPVILLSQVSIMPWTASSMGTPTLTSFLPFMFYGMTEKMDFLHRIGNFLGLLYNEFALTWIYNPKMEKVYRELINSSLPGIREIERERISLALCNSHISFTPPRPLMPDIIEVGGMHLGRTNPLPKELEEFVSGSGENGVILFSMGTALNASSMPLRYKEIFLKAFGKLKQRVLWKWEHPEDFSDVPGNVRVSSWLPQEDLLAHDKVKLFVTHGGHGSTQEAIYHGVPMVTIPMFGDQQHNSMQAQHRGIALPLEFTQLTENKLLDAINQVLNDPKYRQAVKKLSGLFRDQVDHPLDRALYWIEYVLRHQGALHLRSAGRDLSTIQYYSFDVIGTLMALVVITFYLGVRTTKAVVNIFLKKPPNSNLNGGKDAETKKIL